MRSLILGAAPAGCAAALGLTRLGVSVRIVGQPRIDSIEGVSPRTLDLLQAAGLVQRRGVAQRLRRVSRIGQVNGSQAAESHWSAALASRLRWAVT